MQNSNCNKTQKLKQWKNSKTQIVRLKIFNYYKTKKKNLNYDKTFKKNCQNTNCEKTQKLKW